ncbi:hypothetical protein [Methanosarcina horonobensis]|nr:hypothetical protein [Methanosarcina horonobensis]
MRPRTSGNAVVGFDNCLTDQCAWFDGKECAIAALPKNRRSYVQSIS